VVKIILYIYGFNVDFILKKILIIRFSSIGDIVLTTPVIRCIKEQVPECEIHYLTKNQFYPLIKANPHISKIHTIEKGIPEVIDHLKKEDFNYVFDLHKNFRSEGVILRLRKPYSRFPKLNIRKWMLVNLKMNLLPDKHIVDRYFRATRKLKVKNDNKGLDYYIPEEDEIKINSLPPFLHRGFISWAIGGAHVTKIFPIDKIIEIVKLVNFPFIILGGSEDAERGESIAAIDKNRIFNACGKYSVNQSASIIKQSEKLITNDTGMMHIGAAFKKKIVSIWGNTVPTFGMYPYMPDNESNYRIIEVENLSCRPCSKIGYNRCPKKHFRCMEDIDVDSLVEAIHSI
jgi:ADP-heptose:LPS heptosyltransferase